MEFSPDNSLVDRVDNHTQLWRQGDIVELGALAWFAEPRLALTSQSAALSEDQLSSIIADIDQLAIVTQTCDIVRDCRLRPFILLAPIIKLPEPTAGEARRGTRPRYVPVPGHGEDSFIDLDYVVTAEKSLLLKFAPKRGLPDEQSQRWFGTGVARVFSRFAFPDDLYDALRGLVTRVKRKHARNSREGRALEALAEIRIQGTPSWDAQEIDVFIVFSTATRREATEVMTDDEWDTNIDKWLERAEPHGVIRSVGGAMIPLDELTAREYLDSYPLDLEHLSSPPRYTG